MPARTWLKLAVAAIAVVGVAWLFLKTVRDTMSEPFAIDGVPLSGWTLVLSEPGEPGPALVGLRPPEQLSAGLFQQLFRRTMESMTTPTSPTMPVVLQSEYREGLRTVLSAEDIADLARAARLEQASFEPVCMGVKREPAGGRSRQLFFALFEAPAFRAFREALASRSLERDGAERFDPAAVSPILVVASSDADFTRWWPLEVNATTDCFAPLGFRPDG